MSTSNLKVAFVICEIQRSRFTETNKVNEEDELDKGIGVFSAALVGGASDSVSICGIHPLFFCLLLFVSFVSFCSFNCRIWVQSEDEKENRTRRRSKILRGCRGLMLS